MNDEGIELTCQNCNYTWQYHGNNDYYATCPHCLRKVRVPDDHPNNGNEEDCCT